MDTSVAVKTQYIIDQVPPDRTIEFMRLIYDFQGETSVRFRFKADGKASSPIINFPTIEELIEDEIEFAKEEK